MRYRISIIAVALAVSFCGAGQVFAASLASEDFESYNVGDGVDGLTGGVGWNGAWNNVSGGTSMIQSGGLNYSNGGITINGGNRAMHITGLGSGASLPLERPVNALGSVAYLSFLYNNTVNAAGADDFFQIGFDPVAGNNPDVSAIDENTTFRARTGTGTSVDSLIPSNTGETYFVVMRLADTGGAAGYDRVDVYINPDSVDELSNTIDATATVESGLNLIANPGILLFRTARLEAADEFVLDEFRIGTTFADVLPAAVPEPTSIAVWTLLGVLGFGVANRRRFKSSQP